MSNPLVSSSTHAIVIYCPKCDYFRKTAVQVVSGSHGCMGCGGGMECYVPQEMAVADHRHVPPMLTKVLAWVTDMKRPGHIPWVGEAGAGYRDAVLDVEKMLDA